VTFHYVIAALVRPACHHHSPRGTVARFERTAFFPFLDAQPIFAVLSCITTLTAQRAMLLKSCLLTKFLSVGVWTGWRYFDFRPLSVQDYIKAYGIDQAITGRDICFEHRNRDPILSTYIFHSSGRYRCRS
jgi:hypothetical protein